MANYAADGGCLDNDDGSQYYAIHDNFCVYGDHKSDFDGNSKHSFNNLHIYPQVYGAKCLGIMAQVLPPKGYAEGYYNNTCVLQDSNPSYLDISGIRDGKCLDGTSGSKQAFEDGLIVGNNTVYVPANSKAYVKCGGANVSMGDFQKMGYDAGSTTVQGLPSADTIIQWAHAVLWP